MSSLDWSIVGVFTLFIIGTGIYSMRYVRGVTDFLACGRVCGRYVISVADLANGLALVTMIGAVEAGYKSGFAYSFWGSLTSVTSMFLALTGFVVYRFRQTKAMSFGQFVELRYSRKLRIFASTLRSVSEILANMILPALAGRFFICLLDLPEHFRCCGIEVSTFMTVMFICLALAISMILFGGSVTLVITDTVQGLVSYPVLTIFVVFILWKFSWSNEVLPVLLDRAPGESFLNPYEVENLRDFNLFFVFLALFTTILNRGVGLGAGGGSSAARSPHEQKMAGVLGTWRTSFMWIFYIMLVLLVVVFMNHRNFAAGATACRQELTERIAGEIIPDPQIRQEIIAGARAIPVHNHVIGQDAPLSLKKNLDTPYLDVVSRTIGAHKRSDLNGRIPEFATLFHQLMLPAALRKLLPPGLMGLFCMLVLLMIISTDDSRIYSSSMTLSQDLILPMLKKPPAPAQHIRIIRMVTIGIGVFFFCGSVFMSQLEYVNLFILIMYGIWTAGAGIMVLGGLYTRFGTTAGAWSALLSGSGMMALGIVIQRNWAETVYPMLVSTGLAESAGRFFAAVSAPFNPYIVWHVTPFKCPFNAVELSFLSMMFSIVMYCLVSFLTCRHPYNLDRLLHRGKYNTDGVIEAKSTLSLRNFFSHFIGITPEYTRGDKVIAWSVFCYSFGTGFCLFLGVVIWNMFSRWSDMRWGNYYLIFTLIVPSLAAVVTTVWFFIGGVIDLRRMFRDLRTRQVDELDNGVVEGHVSLSDRRKFDAIEAKEK